ncbi:MAG: adenylyltransferase/cytidyltransferase family protein [Pelagibacteraceae bacterium]
MKIISRHKIGLLGGTFDPPHKGHLHISREALNILKLNRLYWSIANQNPLKKLKPKLTISQRTLLSKKIIKKNKRILILKKINLKKLIIL